MANLQTFYSTTFAVPGADPVESRVKGMSAAFGNSPEHKYPIAALPLAGQTLIEVDEMPTQARARPGRDDYLPDGISIVSFVARDISTRDALSSDRDEAPYRNFGQISCLSGSAGELIEILHA
jgi:hypothetical protein